MTIIDLAERKSWWRAVAFLGFAATLLLLLVSTFAGGTDMLNGLWAGILVGAALNLTPLARLLKPNSAIARLLDDDSAREHRRMATTAGFWATIVSGVVLAFVCRALPGIAAYDAVRVVATAAMTATLVAFATLELRASR